MMKMIIAITINDNKCDSVIHICVYITIYIYILRLRSAKGVRLKGVWSSQWSTRVYLLDPDVYRFYEAFFT